MFRFGFVALTCLALLLGSNNIPPQQRVHAGVDTLPSVKVPEKDVKPVVPPKVDPPAPKPVPPPQPTPAPPKPVPPPKPKKAEVPRLVMLQEHEGEVGQFISIKPDTNGTSVKFVPLTPGLSVFPSDQLRDPKSTVVVAMVAGKYKLLAYTALGDAPSEPSTTTIIIGTPPPPVPPPVPPGPTPPGPTPVPVPGQISKVLILYEAQGKNTPAQNIVKTSTKVREYLNKKPGVGNYYFWDYHQQFNPSVPQEWRDVIEEAKKKVTMKDGKAEMMIVIIPQGTVGDYYPVVDEASTVELLKKYGG